MSEDEKKTQFKFVQLCHSFIYNLKKNRITKTKWKVDHASKDFRDHDVQMPKYWEITITINKGLYPVLKMNHIKSVNIYVWKR